MSTVAVRAPLIDEEFLSQYDDLDRPGKPKIIQQLIERLVVSVPVRLASIKSAIETQDADRIRHEAHALKGTLGNVGALSLFETCGELERRAVLKELDDAEARLLEIEVEFAVVAEVLRKRYSSDSGAG